MYCRHLLTLLAASLSIAPVAWASPSFKFIKGGLSGGSSNGGHSSPSTGATSTTSNTHGGSDTKHKIVGIGRNCNTKEPPKTMKKVESKFQKHRRPAKSAKAGPINFPVHFHVIAANRTEEGGDISDETIHKQIEALNDAFDLAMFDWELVNITRTYNPKWFITDFDGDTPLEREIKTATRTGDATTLNVWSANIDGLGYATFPWNWDNLPELDGVVIHYATIPGGAMETYDKGLTLVHEVGHWAGLYHTFDGGSCDGPGDYVSDTPQQAEESRSCTPTDSCSNLPGTDPYTNFMDYSPDECLTEFTTGQIRRMREEIRTYRGIEDA